MEKQEPQIKKAIISDKVGNYENHPFFVEKTKAAKEFLDKVGLPEELKKDYA